MSEPMISLRQVKKSFQKTQAVQSLDLEIGCGKIYGFLGPNGAGKTTTIRMLTGILLPDSGEVKIMGQTYARNREQILNRLGYIPDRAYLYPKLTGQELLNFLGSLRGIPAGILKKRSKDLLAQFELSHKANELIERYSHGMRQKLVLISALMHDPDLLIVDEPMVGLDPRAARQIKKLFRELAEQNKTIFMSTHSLDVAEEVCDQIGIIHHGLMVADDSAASLLKKLPSDLEFTKHESQEEGTKSINKDLEEVFIALTQDEML